MILLVSSHHILTLFTQKVMIAAENPSIPSFLRKIEDRRYEVAPCRRPLHSA